MLPELLMRSTTMPVALVDQPKAIEPDHVFVAPPGHDLVVVGDRLVPVAVAHRSPHLPIDSFFRSLAAERRDRAIAIVLSGTGSDGTLGLKEIKAAVGMVMVQEEASAQYSGMPHSAISTQVVDYVLPADEMPERLLAYVRHGHPAPVLSKAREFEALQGLFGLIRERTGHDFSQYKQTTVGRRIDRRMHVHRIDDLPAYVAYLAEDAEEIELLFKELLIGVTSFFRDPDAWGPLEMALRQQIEELKPDEAVRCWVPGCATGEEAYSLAILIDEILSESGHRREAQIFATDLDATAIDVARAGTYPSGIATDLSPERLRRCFTREDDAYRVRKDIRDMLVFAEHNLIADPPFTKLNMLSCRNLLIYLDGRLQKRLLPIFHYALKDKGLLFLGTSESIGAFGQLFDTVDKKAKVFRRREVAAGTYVAEFPASTVSTGRTASSALSNPGEPTPRLEELADRMLLERLVPPTVLVRERGDVVFVHGRTGRFLEPAPGSQASANLYNMLRPGLQVGVASVLRRAASTDEEIVERGLRLRTDGEEILVNLRARRIDRPEALRGLFSLSFHDVRTIAPDDETTSAAAALASPELADLERELQHSQESHQVTIEELETANEELKSTNEELQSTNEELQSANEELETSKEEMQSLNEELQTVNAELQGKVEELSKANNDMKNLLNGTDIATLFLDGELRIRGYTQQAKEVIRLIPSDIGRPIDDLASTLHYDGLVDDAREVLGTLVFKEREVRAKDHTSYLMRILPYRTTDNVIEGLVLTFIDLTRIKVAQRDQARLLTALRGSEVGVYRQDRDLRITWANGHPTSLRPEDLAGKTDRDLFGEVDAERLAVLKREVIASGEARRERLELSIVGGVAATYDVYVEPDLDDEGRVAMLSTVMITR